MLFERALSLLAFKTQGNVMEMSSVYENVDNIDNMDYETVLSLVFIMINDKPLFNRYYETGFSHKLFKRIESFKDISSMINVVRMMSIRVSDINEIFMIILNDMELLDGTDKITSKSMRESFCLFVFKLCMIYSGRCEGNFPINNSFDETIMYIINHREIPVVEGNNEYQVVHYIREHLFGAIIMPTYVHEINPRFVHSVSHLCEHNIKLRKSVVKLMFDEENEDVIAALRAIYGDN